MKKLFLASYFAFVAKQLLPLLPKSPKDLKLAFIPTAADPYKIKPWFYDRQALKTLGFQLCDVDIKDKNEETLLGELNDVDVLFVSGGNTYYLLEKTMQSGFDKIVKQLVTKGVVYIGSSAGAVLACPTIEHIEDMDDRSLAQLTSFEGLGLVDTLILPHYGEAKYESKFKAITNKWQSKHEMTLLNNKQALVVNNNQSKIVEG